MNLKKISRYFKNNNVMICGKKGKGKDLLMANIINYRNKPYLSLLDYKCKAKNAIFKPLNLELLNMPMDFNNVLKGDFKPYIYPYPDNIDIYLSDCGIYFPSQYNGELNKKFSGVPMFMALSRHLGNTNVHANSQALNRVWDKIREQSEIYIKCQKSIYIKGLNLVIMKIRIYERYQSCIDNVPPFNLPKPIMNKDRIQRYQIEKQHYKIQYGEIKKYTLIFFNKTNYDTRFFKKYLATRRR